MSEPSSNRAPSKRPSSGDAGKAERELGWKPATSFPELVRLMVDADIALLEGRLRGLA